LTNNVLIGRHPKCAIVIDDPTVSRIHAQLIEAGQGQYLFTDQNSTGGTFVLEALGWKRIQAGRVGPDERLRLGAFETSIKELLQLQKAPTNQHHNIVERDPVTGEIIMRAR
jgi:predicted component of type VI protein secretion system